MYSMYFNEQEKYSKIYGPKTIVFMRVGKFYEAYCTKTKGYANLSELEPLLNTKFINRENSKKEKKMPNQFGIHEICISKNLAILMENGYIIPLFEQVRSNEQGIERECIGVYSQGTYLSDKQNSDTNYIMSVYIAEEKQLRSEKNLMAIGTTLIDITTGNSVVHEFYSNKNDERFGLDELVRMMQTFKPTEIVVYFHPIEMNETVTKNLKLYLEIKKYNNCHFYIYFDRKGNDQLNLLSEEMIKINYQNDFFSKIYCLNSQLTLNKKQSALEILDLERKPYASTSLVILLRYIEEHSVLLLKNLSLPSIYMYNKHLILGNNAIEQLNVIDSNNLESYNEKFKSLFDVINKTSTPMGKRFLKQELLNPLSQENKKVILERYDLVEQLIQGKLFKSVRDELKNIYDMERLHRRMGMGIIMPFELYRLDVFYKSTTKIIGLIKNNEKLKKIIPEQVIKDFLSFQIKYGKEFEFDKLQDYSNFAEIKESFFKKGIHTRLDKIQEKIDYVWSLIDSTNTYLTDLISSRCKKNNNNDLISVKSNDVEGYYFTISKSREKILKQELDKKSDTLKIHLTIGELLSIKKDDIEFKSLKKGPTKIFIAPLVEHTLNLSQQKSKLTKLIKKIFIKSMLNHYAENKNTMHHISKFISEIDFLVSGAAVASEYYYCKPQIPSKENIMSYLKTKKLRHSIIERLCNETEYVPYDIELGNIPQSDTESSDDKKKNGQKGRCLDPETPVLMINGKIRKAKDIRVGDQLMGDDSTPRMVLGTCGGTDEMYKIIPIRGDPYIVNGSHILCLKSSGYKSIEWDYSEQRYRANWMENHQNRSKSFSVSTCGSKKRAYRDAQNFLEQIPSERGEIIHISVDDYLRKPLRWRINYYTYHVGVEYQEQQVDLDPYILGHWLGDGDSSGPRFTSADEEIVDYYKKYFDGTGLIVTYAGKYSYSVTTGINDGGKQRNWFMNTLKKYNLIGNKHIPSDYLVNSREVRMAVLAGLIDSDGHNHGDVNFEIVQKNERLADDIVYLARSLGFWCEKKKCIKTCTNSKNGPVSGIYYRMSIIGEDFSELPLLLEYKRPHPENKTMKLDCSISSFKVQKLGVGRYRGFELDENHRFLLGDYTVTHNSNSVVDEHFNKENIIDYSQQESREKNGILLYGINSSGKSAAMKSIGIAVILAQIGYYVPAEEFIYEPYMSLYARITGNDNIFKGLSLFALEMTELDAILMRTEKQGPQTLVIGDEICRGTENISGIAIVSSALVTLSECRSSFIFSSHLHDIPNIDEVKALKNLRLFHLRVEYDEENDCLIFDRKLVPGPGPSIYGLMVAKYLIKNEKFISRAEKIKKRLIKEDKITIPTKKSNFNNDLLVKCCSICNYYPVKDFHKELESHHIYFQKDCLADGKIKEKPYLNKNRLYNLVVLCRKCHVKVHRGEITVNGYSDTSIGPMLNYKINIEKKISRELNKLMKLDKIMGKKINKNVK